MNNSELLTLIPIVISGIATILGALGLILRENNKKEIEVLEKANSYLDKKLEEQRIEILSIHELKIQYVKEIAELRAENAVLRGEIQELREANLLLTEQVEIFRTRLSKFAD